VWSTVAFVCLLFGSAIVGTLFALNYHGMADSLGDHMIASHARWDRPDVVAFWGGPWAQRCALGASAGWVGLACYLLSTMF
jgi:hypothetical protein